MSTNFIFNFLIWYYIRMMQRVGILVLAVVAVLVVGYLLYASQRPAARNVDTSSPGVTSGTDISEQKVLVYFVALEDNGQSGEKIGCGDSLVSVERSVVRRDIESALTELLSEKQQSIGQSGLYSSLSQSDLYVDSIEIVDGLASVRLSGRVQLGGACDSPRFQAQLQSTVTQFPDVREVDILINGQTLEQITSQR